MLYFLPMQFILEIILIVLVTGLIQSILFVIGYGLGRLHLAQSAIKRLKWSFGVGVGIWLLILGVLAGLGFFENFEVYPPRILMVLLLPFAVSLLLLFSRFFNIWLKSIPRRWLLFAQSYRVFLELLLWFGFTIGMIPFHLTFVGFNFDIVVGLTAIPAGLLFFRKGRLLRFEAMVWNVFGLLLLVYNSFIFLISLPYSFQVFNIAPSNPFLTQFPFIWIPGFLVPLAAALHVFSLKQLLNPDKRRSFSLRKRG